MKRIYFTLCTIFYINLIAAVEEKDAKDILLYGNDCHYSCSSCVGKEYYECSSCNGNTTTAILPQSHIDGVIYQKFTNLTIVYGECTCKPDQFQFIQYIAEGCIQMKSLDRFLELALQAMIISNLSLGALNFLTQLKLFFLIDAIELYQFFGNFAMISHKNILITPNIEERFLQLNPTFIMNQQSFSFVSFFEKNGKDKDIQVEKVNSIIPIPSKEEVSQISDDPSVKKEDISSLVDFTVTNKLQKSYLKLSNYLKDQGSQLTYFALSINFQILMLLSYIIMIIFLVSHFLIFEKRYSPKNSSSISPFSTLANQQEENKYKQFSRLKYENSKYFSLYCYMVSFSLGWFYLCVNEQLIYLQIAFYIGDLDSKSIIAIAIFIFLLSINLGQLLFMARRSCNPFTKQKIIIFDKIKFTKSFLARNMVTMKIVFKVIETVVFFQFQSRALKQLYILLGLTVTQFVMTIIIRPFTQAQYNLLSAGQQFAKLSLISIHLGIEFSERQQDKSSLQKLYEIVPSLQFCYLFATLFYNIVMYLQDLFFYCEKRKDTHLANINAGNSFANQSYINPAENKDQSKLISKSGIKGENLISLNQSYLVESIPDQNGSILYEKNKSKELRQLNHHDEQLKNKQETLNSDFFNLGFKRKVGQQTELTINQQTIENTNYATDLTIQNQNTQPKVSKNYQSRTDHLMNSRKKEIDLSGSENYNSHNGNTKSPLQIVQEHRSKNNYKDQEPKFMKPTQQYTQKTNILQFDEMYETVAKNVANQKQNTQHNTTYRK